MSTLLKRRGLRYLIYLMRGVAWPNGAYRFGWGPTAPKLSRLAFDLALAASCQALTTADAAALELILCDTAQVCAAQPTLQDVESLMDRAHRSGITGVRSAFVRVVRLQDGSARFADVSGARRHRRRGVFFDAERDRDREAFNARFGTSILTETSGRARLRERNARVPAGYRHYAPIDFSGGITIGRIASTDSGTGRWEFFNRPIVAPLVAGKRVLDLGSNNASMPLMMLRAGARSVLALEVTPEIADFAQLNAEILAWRDMHSYDIQIRTGDMRLFLTENLGTFDVVTAFCSLYYLPEADMASVVEKAASLGATLILQANEAIDNLPAGAAALRQLMMDHGYATVDVHVADGFARPLLVGRCTAPQPSAHTAPEPTLIEV